MNDKREKKEKKNSASGHTLQKESGFSEKQNNSRNMIKMGKIAKRILTVYSGIVYNKNRYEKYSKKNHFMQVCSLLKRKCKDWFESRQEA